MWSKKICEDIRSTVHRAAPTLSEAVKWSSPCFCGKTNVCGFMAFRKHVTISFWNGVLIEDVHDLFNHGKDNKCGRGIDFFEGDKVPKTKLAAYVKQAVKFDETGEKPAARKTKGAKRAPIKVVVPDELAAAFKQKKHAKAKAFFDSLPPGAQRDFCNWISDAKREETRARRFARTLDELAAGKRWYA